MNKPVLFLALAATVLAVIFAPQDEADDVVAAVNPHASNSANAAGASSASTASSAKASTVSANAAYHLQIQARHFDDGEEVNDKASAKAKLAHKPSAKNANNAVLASDADAANNGSNKLATPSLHWPNAIWGDNLFASTNWMPPPPPPPKPTKAPPPPPPTAPPLPFQYLGRWVEDGKVHYFLQWQDRNLSVEVGAQIDQYKFDSARGGQLRFIYLPLQQVQTLAVGEIN